MASRIESVASILPIIRVPSDAPSAWSESARKITQFFTRLEGIATIFSILAGSLIAALWCVQYGLLVGAAGLAAAAVIALCRSGESTSPTTNIHFYTSKNGELSVTIDTERLHIRSIESTESDHDNYAALFGDPATVEKFATGKTRTKIEIAERIDNGWVTRWREKDPYSGMAIFKKDTDEFVGHIVLGHGDLPGESEFAICLKSEHWGKRYGTEALTALIHEYAPATVKQGYRLEGKPLERIIATSRSDNIASCKIIEKLGMRLVYQEEKFGALRNHYTIELSELQWKTSAKVTYARELLLQTV
jgi:ribosomal-protein-alanine N-acetyltransferase